MKSPLSIDPDTLMLAESLLSKGFAKVVLLGTTTITAFLAAIQTEEVKEAVNQGAGVAIAANSTLRLWCLVGALIGALIRVSVRPPKNLAGFARSFIVSLGFGVLATPLIVRHFVSSPDIDYILAISGASSFLAWIAVEALEKVGTRWIKAKTDQAS